MINVSDIFDVKYGHSLGLNSLVQTNSNEGIPFISRVAGNNGISAFVELISDIEPFPSGELTCALSGNGVMSTFLQNKPYYTGYHIARLIPKLPLTTEQLLFYCYCLNINKFRYNYGRQANKTLASLPIPPLNKIPLFVAEADLERFIECDKPIKKSSPMILAPKKWKAFRFDEIFEIKKGYYNKKPPISEETDTDCVPFIGATEYNNGVTSLISRENLKKHSRDGSIKPDEPIKRKLFPAKCITVSNNGSVGEAFYQPHEFTCSHDVNPLYLKNKKVDFNQFIGLFLCAIIRADKYRWGYGRKWRPIRMKDSSLSLPITRQEDPDWDYMESYIKHLPYSSSI